MRRRHHESENESSSSSDDEDAHTPPVRRYSFSDSSGAPKEFLIDVRKTRDYILRHEDTDKDERVTIEDQGPKHISLRGFDSEGPIRHSVRGNYMISNLLQELSLLEGSDYEPPSAIIQGGPSVPYLAKAQHAVIKPGTLSENPLSRLTRMIKNYFWPALVRRIDEQGVTLICADPKNQSSDKKPRIYIPYGDQQAWNYFKCVADSRPYLDLDVERLPREITSELVKSLNDRPGILCLGLEKNFDTEGEISLRGRPFVVPGGRFNELYGWDSYFIVLGLLEDKSNLVNNVGLCKSIIDNLVYEIENYGMILNANRSYYLLRSQPPFLTDMAMRVFEKLKELRDEIDSEDALTVFTEILGEDSSAKDWLRKVMIAAIKEYRTVWMSEPRLVPEIGLSRYCSAVRGIPPETESKHFNKVLQPFADKYQCSISEFIKMFNDGKVEEVDLETYFLHDRAVRESGHDTTTRLDGRAANIITIDLSSLLYKYEKDIGTFIKEHCKDDQLLMPDDNMESSETWFKAAKERQSLVDAYLWDEAKGMYFDYDFVKGEKVHDYESVTCFWPLWAGLSSTHQADKLINEALPKFEMEGGLVSGTKCGVPASLDKPSRQWDFPYGWAPHQMLAWIGLFNYGYCGIVHRLVYRWLYMITRAFSDFNGVVPEKFDVVKMSHKVDVEYGNVGTDFKRVPREGFGWMNASFIFGQKFLSLLEVRSLGALVPPSSLPSHAAAKP